MKPTPGGVPEMAYAHHLAIRGMGRDDQFAGHLQGGQRVVAAGPKGLGSPAYSGELSG
jgi:hypothetical protein